MSKSIPTGFMNGTYRNVAIEITKKATRIENLAFRSIRENMRKRTIDGSNWTKNPASNIERSCGKAAPASEHGAMPWPATKQCVWLPSAKVRWTASQPANAGAGSSEAEAVLDLDLRMRHARQRVEPAQSPWIL